MCRIVFIATPEIPDTWVRGEPVRETADGSNPVSGLPRYGIVNLPGVTMAQVAKYTHAWVSKIQFDATWYPGAEGYRVTASMSAPSSAGPGSITKAKIQNWLDRWNCVFQSAAVNEVVFDIGVYEAATSDGFWERDVSGISFTKIHFIDDVCRVQANYSQHGTWRDIEGVPTFIPRGPTPTELYIESRSDEVISHDGINRIITFDINRSTLVEAFKSQVRDTLNPGVFGSRKRYYFQGSFVDTVIAAGGVYETTTLNAIANLVDRADLA